MVRRVLISCGLKLRNSDNDTLKVTFEVSKRDPDTKYWNLKRRYWSLQSCNNGGKAKEERRKRRLFKRV